MWFLNKKNVVYFEYLHYKSVINMPILFGLNKVKQQSYFYLNYSGKYSQLHYMYLLLIQAAINLIVI
jgi:hypothetical protein